MALPLIFRRDSSVAAFSNFAGNSRISARHRLLPEIAMHHELKRD